MTDLSDPAVHLEDVVMTYGRGVKPIDAVDRVFG
jgi:hypothetical protein